MATPLRISSEPSRNSELSVPGSSPTSSVGGSPRRIVNEPYYRWGVTQVTTDACPHIGEYLVTAHFSDERHQQMPLSQFISLASYGIDHLVYSLRNKEITFVFKTSERADKFAEGLERSKHGSPPSGGLVDPVSPRDEPIFDRWKAIGAEPHDLRKMLSATVFFEDLDGRREVFRQVSKLAEEYPAEMRVSLEKPVIDFIFSSENAAYRNSFLERVQSCAQKYLQGKPVVRSESQSFMLPQPAHTIVIEAPDSKE